MALAIDVTTPAKATGTTIAITSGAFSPPAGSLLVAFVARNGPAGNNDDGTVTSTGGLTWSLAGRKSTNAGSTGGAGTEGCVEIWLAYAATAPGSITVTDTRADGASGTDRQHILKPVVITGAESVWGGDIDAAFSASGLPSVTSLTARSYSWVFAVSSDWAQAGLGTAGTSQTIIDEDNVAGQYSVHIWRQNSATPVLGTSVTSNLTAPAAQQYNALAIEIRETFVAEGLAQTFTGSPPGRLSPKGMFTSIPGIYDTPTSLDQSVLPAGFDDLDTVGFATLATTYSIAPASILSSETLGFATAAVVSTVAPLGITGSEQLGNPSVSLTLTQVGIPSNEQVSQATVTITYSIAPNGIPSSEASGFHTVANVSTLSPVGIQSSETLGNVTVSTTTTISPTGISSAESFGSQSISLNVTATGTGSSERLGYASVANVSTISPSGIPSQQAFGNQSITLNVSPTGIPTQEALGTIVTVLNVLPAGIQSAEALGQPTVSNVSTIAPYGIPSIQQLGSPSITLNVAPIGIPSAEALGTPTVATVAGLVIAPVGISASEQFGSITLTPGTVTVSPVGIPTQETFGLASVLNVTTITPAGVPGSERLGSPTISHTLNIIGISTFEALGNPTVSTGPVTITPGAVPSDQTLGFASISLVTTISAYGIPSDQKLGSPSVAQTIQPHSIESKSAFGNISITTGAITLSPVGITSSERFGIYSFNATGPGLQVVVVGIVGGEKLGIPIISMVADVSTGPIKMVSFDNVNETTLGKGTYKSINDDSVAEKVDSGFAAPVVR